MTKTIIEPERGIPVAAEVDVCVIGGSCTGVFAAVCAARLGAKVAIIEADGYFGGMATAALVNIWHTVLDIHGERRIISGLTGEVFERLRKRGALIEQKTKPWNNIFNSEELKIDLDEMILESRVRPFLHARFAAPAVEDGRVTAAIIEDKSGRRAIKAAYFVDATGDGDLVHRMGLKTETRTPLQPPTTCAVIMGIDKLRAIPGFNLSNTVHDPNRPGALKDGFLWSTVVPGIPGAEMVAGTRMHNADCSDADQFTAAEIEGRRQVRAMCDILRTCASSGGDITLDRVAACIGIRETRHAICLHRLTENEVLTGTRFPDAIANGTYPVDIHHSEKPGITLRFLDGSERHSAPGLPPTSGRWLPEGATPAPFYQVPFRSLVPRGAKNTVAAGRLIDADRGAYGAIRVMVNCNQTGEAAGTACALALRESLDIPDVSHESIRRALADGGSSII